MAKSRARPVYTPELAHEICRRLLKGETLRMICESEEMPPASTVHHVASGCSGTTTAGSVIPNRGAPARIASAS
jgi:hypothetical protein